MKRRLDDFKSIVNELDCERFYYDDLETKRRKIASRLLEITKEELTKTQREVIMGIYFEKLSVKDLSERMGVCPSAVYRTHKRAIEKVRKYSRYMSLRA